MENKDQITKRNMIFYPLGTVGRDMIYQFFTNFILTFIMVTRQLDAGQLLAITGIMIGARIFDALNDPIMGFIIEKTRTKWGKFKPWLAIGMVSTVAVVITIFCSTLQGWAFVVEFGIIYFLYSITYTMHDISYWGMVPALTSDGETRDKFTSLAVLFAGIGGTLVTMLVPTLTIGESALGGSANSAYAIISVIICVLALGFICFTIFGVKETETNSLKSDAKKISVKDVVKTIIKNKQLLWIVIIFLLQQIGNGLIAGGIGSMYIYFQYGYSGGLYSIFSTVGVAATAVLMIFYPALTKKFHRKPLMNIMMIMGAIGYALMLIAGLLLINVNSTLSFVVITIGYMLSNLGQYAFYLIMMLSILNTVEYNEYICGERNEAIITSVRPFVTKMASALVIALTSATYLIFGVTDTSNAISNFENQQTEGIITSEEKVTKIGEVIASISSNQKLGMLLVMCILPLVFMVAAYFLYQSKYKLDEAEFDRICAELKERKASQQAQNQDQLKDEKAN